MITLDYIKAKTCWNNFFKWFPNLLLTSITNFMSYRNKCQVTKLQFSQTYRERQTLTLCDLSLFDPDLNTCLHLQRSWSEGMNSTERALEEWADDMHSGLPPNAVNCIQTKVTNVQHRKDVKVQWEATSLNVHELLTTLLEELAGRGSNANS